MPEIILYLTMLLYVIIKVIFVIAGGDMQYLEIWITIIALLGGNVIAFLISNRRISKKLDEICGQIKDVTEGNGYSIKELALGSGHSIQRLSEGNGYSLKELATGADNSHLALKKKQQELETLLRELKSKFDYKTAESNNLQSIINSLQEYNIRNDLIITQLKEQLIELEQQQQKEKVQQHKKEREQEQFLER